jgi:hypothetical protein
MRRSVIDDTGACRFSDARVRIRDSTVKLVPKLQSPYTELKKNRARRIVIVLRSSKNSLSLNLRKLCYIKGTVWIPLPHRSDWSLGPTEDYIPACFRPSSRHGAHRLVTSFRAARSWGPDNHLSCNAQTKSSWGANSIYGQPQDSWGIIRPNTGRNRTSVPKTMFAKFARTGQVER